MLFRLWDTKRTEAPSVDDLLHAFQTLLLEDIIADTQDLIDDENVGINMSRDRKSEPRIHARGIAFDRSIDELLDPGKVDDLIDFRSISRRVMPRIVPFK